MLQFQEFEAPRISRQSAYEGRKFVSPTHGPPLSLRRYPSYSFLLKCSNDGYSSSPGPEGYNKFPIWLISMCVTYTLVPDHEDHFCLLNAKL